MSVEQVNVYPQLEACELCLSVTSQEFYFGGRWVVILISPDSTVFSAYCSVGSPYRESPYKRKHLLGQKNLENVETSKTSHLVGCIQEEQLKMYSEVFFATAPGPDQFFAVRFLHGLGKVGLIEQLIVRLLLAQPKYCAAEADYYYNNDNLSAVDYRFYTEELAKSGFDVKGVK